MTIRPIRSWAISMAVLQFALLDLIGGFGNPACPITNATLQAFKTVMTPECAANALSMVSTFG